MLQTLLVGIVGSQQIALSVQSSTLAAPTLGPVGLDLGGLLGVLQRIVPVLLGSVGGRSVAVEDVVFGLNGNSLGELGAIKSWSALFSHGCLGGTLLVGNLHSLVKVLLGDCLVAQSLELVRGSHFLGLCLQNLRITSSDEGAAK